MSTTPLTGYYSTGYYYNSISAVPIDSSSLGHIVAKAIDNNKIYAYSKELGTITLAGTTVYPNLTSGPDAPIIETNGLITGSLSSITSFPYTTGGDPLSSFTLEYDSSIFTGIEFWQNGLSATGTWNDGLSAGGTRLYVAGRLLANGIYLGQYYNNGILGSTFRAPDGKAYVNGDLFSGIITSKPGVTAVNPLGWPNFRQTAPAPSVNTLFTNGLSARPPIRYYADDTLYVSNLPFVGTIKMDTTGLITMYNRSRATANLPVMVPLSAVNSNFVLFLKHNIVDVIFNQGKPVTGLLGNTYYYKGLPTTNISLTSHSLHFRNGKLAHGLIGGKIYSYGTLID